MSNNPWTRGFDPTTKLAQIGEATVRLSRIMLFQRLQQAESQLITMGVPNNISSAFLKDSEEMLKEGFKKPKFRCIQVDTTSNSTF